MIFYPIEPSPLLAGYVRYYWVLEGDVQPGEHYTHRTMASGCPELCFHYKGSFCELADDNKLIEGFQTGIHGQSLRFRRFQTRESFGLFGAFLYPFAVPLLFGIPATEINNQMIDLASLLGRQGEILSEKMLTAPNNSMRAQVLSTFLESRLPKEGASRVIPAIRQVIVTGGQIPIQSLSDQYFLSGRQFTRAFSEFAGFAPKLFSRLLRFEQALGNYGNKDRSLTEIAYDCGYYDQSHFIHEFKEFSGHHPRHYFSGKAEGTEWKD